MAKQFLVRLATEHKEARVRLERLLHFLGTYHKAPNDLTSEERDLMFSQVGVMYHYMNILERRLSIHGIEIESYNEDGIILWRYIDADGNQIDTTTHE